jgi:Fe-S cluster biogenesis protein NfuA
MRDGPEFHKRVARMEELIQSLESAADPVLRAAAQELARTILDLHAAGLTRMQQILVEEEPEVLAALARDDLISHLFLLHGIHPAQLHTRVRHALEKVQPQLRSLGGQAELLDLKPGSVRLCLHVTGAGRSLIRAMQQWIEEALCEAAPDISAIDIDIAEEGATGRLVPLPLIGSKH